MGPVLEVLTRRAVRLVTQFSGGTARSFTWRQRSYTGHEGEARAHAEGRSGRCLALAALACRMLLRLRPSFRSAHK